MLTKYLKFQFFFLSFFIVNHLVASDTIVVLNAKQILDVSPSLLLYEDKTNQLQFDEITSKHFENTHKKVPSLGISKSTFWVKLIVKNQSNTNLLLLNLSLPTLDFVEFYSPNENNIYKSMEMGEHLPFNQRQYDDPDYIFDVFIPIDQTKVYYIKVSSREGIQLPITIGSKDSILEQLKFKGILSGIYFGIMFVIIFYNLFIYFSVKDNNYLYYVIYVLFTFITQTSLQGYTFQFFWPDHPAIATYILFISPSLTGITGILFMRVFLEVKRYSPLLNKLTYILCIPYVLSVGCLLLKNYIFSQIILEVNSLIIAVFMLITPIIILRKGFKPAKFFLFAWSVFLVGICIYILKDMEILPFNNFTRYTMQIGSAIETVLLSLALADRINILKKEKEQSQASVLIALQENQKLIKEQNIVLEQKVQERTIELNHTNAELNATLSDLKDTQVQMVNVEKMASLGQLTAGIAHEINNPINFVSANVKPLKLDIEDVLGLIEKYENITINQSGLEEIDNYKKQIDYDYVKKEMTDLLSGIEDGARRTAEIVSGLKNFSRLDESDLKISNINDGIKSTLILLKSTIPDDVHVVVELGDIPNIECYPGKLNQVFMNLLNNAIYAINKNIIEKDKKLVIRTYEQNDHIYISIEDTGIGMTPEVKAKVFEPFYTTKDVGEGTGLGMSIVFKIIESHQAKIEIESEYGKGTKILMILNKKLS